MTLKNTLKNMPLEDVNSQKTLQNSLLLGSNLLLSQQFKEGYWWYILEANEGINAEYIFMCHYMGLTNVDTQKKIAQRLVNTQAADGSWNLFYSAAGDLHTTIECYLALRLCGYDTTHPTLLKAKEFILKKGGLTQTRAFTRIHLAQFGLIPWEYCPAMPVAFIHMPAWSPLSIYDFSSWARATIVPLLVLLEKKVTRKVDFNLDELYVEKSAVILSEAKNPSKTSRSFASLRMTNQEPDWSFKTTKGAFSFEQFMINLDKTLKKFEKYLPAKKSGLQACETWIRAHLEKTEDIYPALAYGAQALHVLGYSQDDPMIKKALKALEFFQTPSASLNAAIPTPDKTGETIYQQCCVSPVWDTPWAGVALAEAGVPRNNPQLVKAGEWLLSKQILDCYGDWYQKNKGALPGGWSFEFENDYFPDVDDTFEVLLFLSKIDIPQDKFIKASARALTWIVSMQSSNGGWGAFDKNSTKEILNKIPFSDHEACLDQPSADLTGRALEVFKAFGYTQKYKPVKKAIKFLENTQEQNGSWWARWGVNYLYGTWCALQGLQAIGYDMQSDKVKRAVSWLKSVQNVDGGYSESCDSYVLKRHTPYPHSTASQTAWALMGLIAGGEGKSLEAKRAADYLINSQNVDGTWDEPYHTGTGFPGHFYIRYHGYRHFFPVLALGKYKKI
ncbi:squalene--hopene cyclase [bacterium]|nr:squalene--hopene cyclase [bacterium]